MPSDTELLRLLNRPGYHTGPELGRRLGVSRVAIQKRVARLAAGGLPVERHPGRGYRLPDGVTLLERERISDALPAALHERISVFDLLLEVDSTSTHLSQYSVSPGDVGVCISEAQRQGRGRFGRDWVATPYRNIMLSLSWSFTTWPAALSGLSLAAGVAMVEALESCGVDSVRIKWPNDLLLADKKVAGILVDARGEASTVCQIVMGLGLNVWLDDETAEAIDQPFTDLRREGFREVDRNALVAACIRHWVRLCEEFERGGFTPFRDRWERYNAFAGAEIDIHSRKDRWRGTIVGTDEHGALVVEKSGGGLETLVESDVSIRRVESSGS